MRWLQYHTFLLLYIVFTVGSQLIMRWQVGTAGAASPTANERIGFIVSLLMTPWVWAAFACTFLAGVAWMLTLSRFELTYAFPFTGLSFLLILLAGAFMFGEHVSVARIAGTSLVLIGLIIVVRS